MTREGGKIRRDAISNRMAYIGTRELRFDYHWILEQISALSKRVSSPNGELMLLILQGRHSKDDSFSHSREPYF